MVVLFNERRSRTRMGKGGDDESLLDCATFKWKCPETEFREEVWLEMLIQEFLKSGIWMNLVIQGASTLRAGPRNSNVKGKNLERNKFSPSIHRSPTFMIIFMDYKDCRGP